MDRKDLSPALKRIESFWDQPAKETGDVPDGVYQCEIKSGTIALSKNRGETQCVWKLRIAVGDFINRTILKFANMESEDGMGYFRADLAKLGVEWPSKLADVPGAVEETVGTYCEVRQKTTTNEESKKEYKNLYFIRAIEPIAGEDDSSAEAMVEEEKEVKPVRKVGKGLAAKRAPQEAEAEEPEGAESPDLLLEFEEDEINESAQTKIQELMAEHGLKLSEYESHKDALTDICKKIGVSGTFATVKLCLKEVIA